MNVKKLALGIVVVVSIALAALSVPPAIQMPGTQPGQAGTIETPDKCDNCHGGYNRAVEPSFNWRGSMMANATRDPIFWATLAVAEQDFDGVGDLCLRCHSTSGWYAGRSTPTDGSGLLAGDSDGVECDSCHKMTNPNNKEFLGVMISPFIANKAGEGFYGSGMLSRWTGSDKLGPYADADARHQFKQSKFHRDVDFCGSCHDVSNPVTGDLAPGNGAQNALPAGAYSGSLGSALSAKAAFLNPPYLYGVVERTFSEFKSGALSKTLVSSYSELPAELKAGATKAAFDSAGGNYKDSSPRYFSCQTCHMRAVTGPGCNKAGVLIRQDLPLHDMTGGNYWAADAILWQNSQGQLRLGGGLTPTQIDAIRAGKDRAKQQLSLAATLSVTGNTLRIVNLTGHKLISGYPEGRRMWVNTVWYDSGNNVLREDGKYGAVADAMKSLIDLKDPNTKVYEAHYGMTQDWAAKLISLGYPSALPLSYDRTSGAVTMTLGNLASAASGTTAETFHFALNNVVVKDNRIPPYGFDYTEAAKRNALPVPAQQYGSPTSGGSYNYWDSLALNPPAGASYAQIRLMYQPTSWEYVQFLKLANTKSNAFLANEGDNLMSTWINTGMAEPYVMASATWGTAPTPPCTAPSTPLNVSAKAGKKSITLSWSPLATPPTGGYRIYYLQAGKLQLRGSVAANVTSYTDSGLTSRISYTYVVTAYNLCNNVITESAVSNQATATAQ